MNMRSSTWCIGPSRDIETNLPPVSNVSIRVEQFDTPQKIESAPATGFVKSFPA